MLAIFYGGMLGIAVAARGKVLAYVLGAYAIVGIALVTLLMAPVRFDAWLAALALALLGYNAGLAALLLIRAVRKPLPDAAG
jgi:hypothetical protein